MKVLKILGIVFGVLLLLTGAGLMVGSIAASKGDDAMQQSMQNSGLAGPVSGIVKTVNGQQLSVVYTDKQGQPQTAEAQAALTRPAKVGDTVSVYYSPDQPTVAVVTDLAGGSLSRLANGLRTGGVICLVLGGLMLLAGILGLALGRRTPTVALAGPPPGPYPPQPGQQYLPQQPGQQYPPQPGQQYPPQQYPPQQYTSQQPGQQQPPQGPQYPAQPGQQFPPQPNAPQQNAPQQNAPRPPQVEPPAEPPVEPPVGR